MTNAVTLQQASVTLVQLKALRTDFIRFGARRELSDSFGRQRTPSSSASTGTGSSDRHRTRDDPWSGHATYVRHWSDRRSDAYYDSVFAIASKHIIHSACRDLTTIGFTSPGTANGATLIVRAQNSTGSVVGGALVLESGVGTPDGNIDFVNGNTTTMVLTEASLTLLPVNFYLPLLLARRPPSASQTHEEPVEAGLRSILSDKPLNVRQRRKRSRCSRSPRRKRRSY